MRLVKPGFEVWSQTPGFIGILKQIEKAGRRCYKSEDKITDISAIKFVDMLIERNHDAMLEHGTVYLKFKWYQIFAILYYIFNPYSHVRNWIYVTTNYRVIIENEKENHMRYLCDSPCEEHVKRVTTFFVCDRGVTHEFVRHRVFSFAQESTRYCNYLGDKFGKMLTFIIPCWMNLKEGVYKYGYIYYGDDVSRTPQFYETLDNGDWFCNDEEMKDQDRNERRFLDSLDTSEKNYLDMIEDGWQPQQARSVLPNALKSELVMTGTCKQWRGFFKLRCASTAHPQAQELAIPLEEEFIKRGYIIKYPITNKQN